MVKSAANRGAPALPPLPATLADWEALVAARLAAARPDDPPAAREEDTTRACDLNRQPVFLLGAGAVLARPFVRQALATLPVRAVVDNTASPSLQALAAAAGLPVLGSAALPDLYRRWPDAVAVLCASGEAGADHYAAAAEALGLTWLSLVQGLRRTADPDWAGHFGDLEMLRRLLDRRDVQAALADATSRITFLALLLARLTGSLHWLAPIRRPESSAYFFTGILTPAPEAVLVDGGAWNGDTARAFHRATAGRHGHIHAFEPAASQHPALQATAAALGRMTVHPAGLWQADGWLTPAAVAAPDAGSPHLRFAPEGAFAAVSEPVSERVSGPVLGAAVAGAIPVCRLDSLDLEGVSLIKLDVEGAEAAALRGAAATLGRDRPQLAVCVYHRPEDLVALPDLVRALRPDSRLFLRHHGPSLFETVLYAL